jgi:hypothetical protein
MYTDDTAGKGVEDILPVRDEIERKGSSLLDNRGVAVATRAARSPLVRCGCHKGVWCGR